MKKLTTSALALAAAVAVASSAQATDIGIYTENGKDGTVTVLGGIGLVDATNSRNATLAINGVGAQGSLLAETERSGANPIALVDQVRIETTNKADVRVVGLIAGVDGRGSNGLALGIGGLGAGSSMMLRNEN